MEKITETMTVFFEEPFWVGFFERIDNGNLYVCKVTFGAEPKDYEIYEFVRKNYYRLKFSTGIKTEIKETKQNPKRIQREIKQRLEQKGVGTKSQQALKLQYEQNKTERKTVTREMREAEKQRQYELKQKKKKEKHKGR
ncbi:MAG: YjdF family protein [Clostridia bacterium]|nr:YjdF family protein [Clostridia bacterium]